MRREPTCRCEPRVEQDVFSTVHTLLGIRDGVTRQRANQREKAKLVGRHPVELIVVAADTRVGIHQPVDLVRRSMLEHLPAECRPALDLLGKSAVFCDTHRLGHAIVVDPGPVSVFRDQADRERHIERVERVAQCLERRQIIDSRHILDSEIRAVLLLVENAKHVVEQILKGQRPAFKAGRDHRHVGYDPEISALHHIGPGFSCLIESRCMNLHLVGVEDFKPTQAEIKLILLQLGFLVDHGRMLVSRIGEKP